MPLVIPSGACRDAEVPSAVRDALDDPGRILLLGDVHGRAAWVARALEVAAEAQARLVVQLGDFGYWEHTDRGAAYLDAVDAHAAATGIPVCFIRGNHDNVELLQRRYPPSGAGFVPLRPWVFWIPDATRWEWSRVSFAAAGGGISIDRAYRIEGEDWWADEALGRRAAAILAEEGPADVVLAHDAPDGAGLPRSAYREALSEEHRRTLRSLLDVLCPRWVFHGHYHLRNSARIAWPDGTVGQIEGLDMDGTFERSWYVCDVADLRQEPTRPGLPSLPG